MLDLLHLFDEALDWPLDDPLLAEHRPSPSAADEDDPWRLAGSPAA